MFDDACPQLRIAGPKCHLVKSQDLEEGSWFLDYPNGDFEPLENPLNMKVHGARYKAVDWIVCPPVVTMDPDSPCYKAIKLRSNRDSEKCLWGTEYAILINPGIEALLYLGNKSSRPLISSIRVGGEYVLIPQKRIHDDFIWYIPNIIDVEQLK